MKNQTLKRLLEATDQINHYLLVHGANMFTISVNFLQTVMKGAWENYQPLLEYINSGKLLESLSDDSEISLSGQVDNQQRSFAAEGFIPVTYANGKKLLPLIEVRSEKYNNKNGNYLLSQYNKLNVMLFHTGLPFVAKLTLNGVEEFLASEDCVSLLNEIQFLPVEEYENQDTIEGMPTKLFFICFIDSFLLPDKLNVIKICDYHNQYLEFHLNAIAYKLNTLIPKHSGWSSVVVKRELLKKKDRCYRPMSLLYYLMDEIWERILKDAKEVNWFFSDYISFYCRKKAPVLNEFLSVKYRSVFSMAEEKRLQESYFDQKGIRLEEITALLKEFIWKPETEGAIVEEKPVAVEQPQPQPEPVLPTPPEPVAEVTEPKIQQMNNEQLLDMIQQMINQAVEDIVQNQNSGNAVLGDALNQLSLSMEDYAKKVTAVDELLVQYSLEKREEDLVALLSKKMNALKNYIADSFPALEADERLLFLLAVAKLEDKGVLSSFLGDICSEAYKTSYLSRVKQGNHVLYTFESVLGECVVYKNAARIHVLSLNLKDAFLLPELREFFANNHTTANASIYYDGEIYKEFEELIASARKSIHIIMPWVFEYPSSIYVPLLKAAASKNVALHLKYGYLSLGSNESVNKDNREKFARSKDTVAGIKRTIPALQTREDDTHIKAVVIDKRIIFIGSCNLLSFRHNYDREPDFRHETMLLIEDEQIADMLLRYYEE